MRSEDEMVAYALETHTALLPYLPELLADLQELGGNAEAISSVLDDLNLTKSATVADLGCGKGAVAVAVAEALNFKVVGIDLFEPFIESCRELAERHGVSDLCHFINGDILKLAGKIGPCDVAVFAALGDVLGPLDQTVSVIRQYVRPGGFMVISDGFIKDGGSSDFPGFEQYAERAEMITRLSACGDTLVREIIDEDSIDGGEDEMIAVRARAIAARQPEIAADVLNYAAMQSAEYEYIRENFVSAIWVLNRSY
ncbi:MAG: class I SAM-dependent methyltransferase [Gammaproteobacteria bacterium]|nr:class I SAM-dependent methyltransferase [Gammaproteobacteria bacterium]MDH3430063.1 class I SAM-dependent methyltransferase [Gammaproteobacteria bacterium]